MVALIDASVLIALERGKLAPEEIARVSGPSGTFALASITASELLDGVHRAKTADLRARRQAFVEHFLARLPIVPFDLASARIHAQLWAGLAEAGKTMGAHDLLIAATAMAIGARVITRDRRSFPLVSSLAVVLC